MLEMRGVCERCDTALSDGGGAVICSFECTFCTSCVEDVLMNVCPNCGGGLTPRPIRPRSKLVKHPAGTRVVEKPVDAYAHAAFAATIKDVPPERR